MKDEEMSMKAKKWTSLLTSIATLTLVTACTQTSTQSNTSTTNSVATATATANKTSYFTDKDTTLPMMKSLHQL